MSVVEYLLSDSFAWIFLAFIAGEILGGGMYRKKEGAMNEQSWMVQFARMVQKVLARWKHRKFCKLNGYYCPDCIYHDFIWDGIVFRGNRCQYPR